MLDQWPVQKQEAHGRGIGEMHTRPRACTSDAWTDRERRDGLRRQPGDQVQGRRQRHEGVTLDPVQGSRIDQLSERFRLLERA